MSPAPSTPSRNLGRERLPELCNDLFAFALGLRTAKDPGAMDQLQGTMARLLEKLGQRAREAGVDSAHLDAARYALCALLDEIVLGSRWELKTHWFQQPLQMIYFGDFTAGEQFYRRLDELRGDAEHNVDAIEVYAQCLAIGFRGKYADLAGMQKVDDLLAELGEQTRRARGVTGPALSKSFVRTESLPTQVRRLPVWVAAASAAGVVLLLWLLLSSLLSSQADQFLANTELPR
ncbi:MAG: DotU family type IV/VI secretion system protein [Planctomycetes bacterium]|nr:DotU family type IV/VI secretion system protein [Planctomycetota bacterium]